MGQKEPSPGQSETKWSDTLGKMHPDGPRPTGARGNIRNAFPYEPFQRSLLPLSGRRVCGWPGYPGCRSLHSLYPGLGSSCPFGAFTSNRILMRMFFHDNKDNTIGALTANSIPVRNWKSVKKRRKKPWKSVNFLCFIPWKSVKKRRKKPWKSVICRSLCPVYKQNIAIYIITRTITDVHGRHGELLYDSSCVNYFR